MPLVRHALWIALVGFVLSACAGDDLLGSDSADVEGATTWTLPTEVLAAGRLVRNPYDAAPLWRGASSCAGRLRDGGRDLGVYLRDRYPAIDTVGGYACRRNTADTKRMSVHGTGRALDLMIPKRGGRADSTRGDVVANFLVTNATKIGVQLIIWNRTIWRANGTNAGRYGGPHPHDDHIHVEITNEAARRGTPWFLESTGDAGDEMADAGADSGDEPSTGETDDDAGLGEMDAGAIAEDAGAAPMPEEEEDEPEAADAGAPTSEPEEGEYEEENDGSGGYEYEIPEGESDEPAKDDALTASKKRRPLPSFDDEPLPASACSAAPPGTAGGGLAFAAAFAAVAVAASRRRRR